MAVVKRDARNRTAYNREWRRRNADKLRAQGRARRAANPEKYRQASRRFRERHPNYDRQSYAKNVVTSLLRRARSRARARALPFDLLPADIVIPSHCPVLGIELTIGGGRGFRDSSPTLDRVDNNLGYVRGNVAVISYRANRIKNDASLDELRRLVTFLEGWKP